MYAVPCRLPIAFWYHHPKRSTRFIFSREGRVEKNVGGFEEKELLFLLKYFQKGLQVPRIYVIIKQII